jgi:hypothetical protein
VSERNKPSVDRAGSIGNKRELAALADEIAGRLQAGDGLREAACAAGSREHAKILRRLLPAMKAMVALGEQLGREEGRRTRARPRPRPRPTVRDDRSDPNSSKR